MASNTSLDASRNISSFMTKPPRTSGKTPPRRHVPSEKETGNYIHRTQKIASHTLTWTRQQHDDFIGHRNHLTEMAEALRRALYAINYDDELTSPVLSLSSRQVNSHVSKRRGENAVQLQHSSGPSERPRYDYSEANESIRSACQITSDCLYTVNSISALLAEVDLPEQYPDDAQRSVDSTNARLAKANNSEQYEFQRSDQTSLDEPAILTEYYDTAAEVKILYERLADLVSLYSEERADRDMLIDQEASLPLSDDAFETSYQRKKEDLNEKLEHAIEKLKSLREQCSENGYHIAVHEDADAVSTDDSPYAATTPMIDLGTDESKAAANRVLGWLKMTS